MEPQAVPATEASTTTATTVAAKSYYIVELPFLRLKRRLQPQPALSAYRKGS
jgi:hypothetical protein